MKFLRTIIPAFLVTVSAVAQEGRNCFIDGYHGGIWGHYPEGFTSYYVDQLEKNPKWKINLEIEPETWDIVEKSEPEAYRKLQEYVREGKRVEFQNVSYAQPYMYNISGESIIRQFLYGQELTLKHFPEAKFRVYSCEEPCFTSSLPTILSSLGYKYASTKNPDTCYGGYFSPFGKDLLTWVGPDRRSRIVISPRYDNEILVPTTAWQTIAWRMNREYADSCRSAGIRNPIGMTLQDAGWKNGPWMGDKVRYVTWSEYFALTDAPAPEHNFTQEDVRVSLFWGGQILQNVARQVRSGENAVIQAEKAASIASVRTRLKYPQNSFDNAWRNLMLSQHHDCWIVPCNRHSGKTWAERVDEWTDNTRAISRGCNALSAEAILKEVQDGTVRALIVNTTGYPREEAVKGSDGKWWMTSVPALGYTTVRYSGESKTDAAILEDGTAILSNGILTVKVDPAKGGAITSITDREGEYVEEGFNTLSAYYPRQGCFHTSREVPAEVSISEKGPFHASITIKSSINGVPAIQIISLSEGSRILDCSLKIFWSGKSEPIGEFVGKGLKLSDHHSPRFNSRYKMHLNFPTILNGQLIKNAPFDICESRLESTFYSDFDSIENDVIMDWVDQGSIALFSDHTTSYLYGGGHPLGLTVQYVGPANWYGDINVNGPSEIHYALLPHRGDWKEADIARANQEWKEPLMMVETATEDPASLRSEGNFSWSLMDLSGTGYTLEAAYVEGKDIVVRLFNVSGDSLEKEIPLGFRHDGYRLEELDGKVISSYDLRGRKIKVAIPPLGIATVRITWKASLPWRKTSI